MFIGTARANKPWGWKAILITRDDNGRLADRTTVLDRAYRLTEDGRDLRQCRAGTNFQTKAEALAFAQDYATKLAERGFVARWLHENYRVGEDGRKYRRTEAEALEAYANRGGP